MSNSLPTALDGALATSITTGGFVDTTYYLFSSRLSSGKIGKPRAVYANSAVMRAAGQHFQGQLSAGFATRNEIAQETADYGYDSDSDLEDDEGESPEESLVTVVVNPNDEMASENSDENPTMVQFPVPRRTKHTVVVSDVAANTWQALVFYILTGVIHFAPLRSQGLEYRMQEITQYAHDHPGLPPLCSPKSMYRLADKVGLVDLKNLAMKDLEEKLPRIKILDEIFSKYSSVFPEILMAQVNYFCDEEISQTSRLSLQQKIRSVTKGELPHATNALMAMLQKVSDSRPGASPEPQAAKPPAEGLGERSAGSWGLGQSASETRLFGFGSASSTTPAASLPTSTTKVRRR
ncbi:hypothetical protein NLI96_g4038 [Meripilus lineatus]|uniref:Uncharacterized protein n=1 Tax=Meripilus lineatus TaxID=2056292 RepID=A0AAD5V7Q2_9APHY|nr:hypothetical protein NLI96_g4038 [Physisporinus lineatus]